MRQVLLLPLNMHVSIRVRGLHLVLEFLFWNFCVVFLFGFLFFLIFLDFFSVWRGFPLIFLVFPFGFLHSPHVLPVFRWFSCFFPYFPIDFPFCPIGFPSFSIGVIGFPCFPFGFPNFLVVPGFSIGFACLSVGFTCSSISPSSFSSAVHDVHWLPWVKACCCVAATRAVVDLRVMALKIKSGRGAGRAQEGPRGVPVASRCLVVGFVAANVWPVFSTVRMLFAVFRQENLCSAHCALCSEWYRGFLGIAFAFLLVVKVGGCCWLCSVIV